MSKIFTGYESLYDIDENIVNYLYAARNFKKTNEKLGPLHRYFFSVPEFHKSIGKRNIFFDESKIIEIDKNFDKKYQKLNNLKSIFSARSSLHSENVVSQRIELSDIQAICKTIYSSRGKDIFFTSYPSGGALYPCDLFVVLPIEEKEYIAYVDPYSGNLSIYKEISIDVFNEECIIANSQVAPAYFIISVNISRSHAKYGSKSYQFSLLEAGHLMQNILLSLSQLNLESRPMGGFQDININKIMDFDGIHNFVTYICGIYNV